MRSFLLRRGKFVELTLGEAHALRTLRDIQREKSKRLLRRNLLQENLPMKVKKMGILQNKRMIYIYISDVETEDNNNEEDVVEMSQPHEEPHEDENNRDYEPIIMEDPQSSKEKSKKEEGSTSTKR
jgi:hypothetical protein